MSKTLVFSARSDRAFNALPESVRHRLTEALYRYGDTGHGDVKRMVGDDALRLRVGDYRVILDETAESLFILDVGHRHDIYR